MVVVCHREQSNGWQDVQTAAGEFNTELWLQFTLQSPVDVINFLVHKPHAEKKLDI